MVALACLGGRGGLRGDVQTPKLLRTQARPESQSESATGPWKRVVIWSHRVLKPEPREVGHSIHCSGGLFYLSRNSGRRSRVRRCSAP